jgi:hypothetical protein
MQEEDLRAMMPECIDFLRALRADGAIIRNLAAKHRRIKVQGADRHLED